VVEEEEKKRRWGNRDCFLFFVFFGVCPVMSRIGSAHIRFGFASFSSCNAAAVKVEFFFSMQSLHLGLVMF